ncbi:MAG: fatty acid desaturase [Gammaproteobacteria bacterium]
MTSETIIPTEIGDALPVAVEGGPSALDKDDLKAIIALNGDDVIGFYTTIVITWLTIAATIAGAVYLDHWVATAAAIFLIATRQNVLGLLNHDQVHRLGHHSKFGDLFTNIFCAFPILITLQGYRHVHLTHHRKYFTADDPDYLRKQGHEYNFPQKPHGFLFTVIKDLIGLNLIATVRGKAPSNNLGDENREPVNRALQLGFYAALATALTATNTWYYFLLYWFLPIVTVLQVIVRWGAICEQRYNLVDPSMEESTPLIKPRWWEAYLLPNLNFNLHIYHHWFPKVGYRNLPKVHEIFVRNGLVNEQNVFNGYVDYLMFLLGKGAHHPDNLVHADDHGSGLHPT